MGQNDNLSHHLLPFDNFQSEHPVHKWVKCILSALQVLCTFFSEELFRYSSFVDIKQRKGRPEGKGTTIQVHKSNIFANFLMPRS